MIWPVNGIGKAYQIRTPLHPLKAALAVEQEAALGQFVPVMTNGNIA